MQTPKQFYLKFILIHLQPNNPSRMNETVLEGWVMKKRRRRMQGWAKRYLKLDTSGILSYYSQPGSTCRGTLKVAESVINVNSKKKAIDIGMFGQMH